MKELYQTPEFEIVSYESEETITSTSGLYGDNDFIDPWGKI